MTRVLESVAHRFAIWDSKAESFTQSLVSAGTWVQGVLLVSLSSAGVVFVRHRACRC